MQEPIYIPSVVVSGKGLEKQKASEGGTVTERRREDGNGSNPAVKTKNALYRKLTSSYAF